MTSCADSPSSEIYLSASCTPTRRATSETVSGLSPDMTLTATSFSLNHLMVSTASPRIWSSMIMRQSGRRTAGRRSPRMSAGECARHITRKPCEALSSTSFLMRTPMSLSTNSGAPSIYVPMPSNVTAESLRADENGSTVVGRNFRL